MVGFGRLKIFVAVFGWINYDSAGRYVDMQLFARSPLSIVRQVVPLYGQKRQGAFCFGAFWVLVSISGIWSGGGGGRRSKSGTVEKFAGFCMFWICYSRDLWEYKSD